MSSVLFPVHSGQMHVRRREGQSGGHPVHQHDPGAQAMEGGGYGSRRSRVHHGAHRHEILKQVSLMHREYNQEAQQLCDLVQERNRQLRLLRRFKFIYILCLVLEFMETDDQKETEKLKRDCCTSSF